MRACDSHVGAVIIFIAMLKIKHDSKWNWLTFSDTRTCKSQLCFIRGTCMHMRERESTSERETIPIIAVAGKRKTIIECCKFAAQHYLITWYRTYNYICPVYKKNLLSLSPSRPLVTHKSCTCISSAGHSSVWCMVHLQDAFGGSGSGTETN